MPRTYSSRDLTWKDDGLYLGGKGKPVVTIVPDEKYPSMWRVELPDGRLTDMVNRTRTKDAAQSIALSILNGRRGEELSRAAE
jgi:hypothetical protein